MDTSICKMHIILCIFFPIEKKKKAKRSEAESDPPLYGRHWVEVQIFLFLISKICEKREFRFCLVAFYLPLVLLNFSILDCSFVFLVKVSSHLSDQLWGLILIIKPTCRSMYCMYVHKIQFLKSCDSRLFY